MRPECSCVVGHCRGREGLSERWLCAREQKIGKVPFAITGKLAGMAKRGYSREFTPKTERRVRFEIDRIPPTLLDGVKAKAKREGVSLRTLTLRLWSEWVRSSADPEAT